ncbi:acetolactate synthase small subunit [Natranaerovirga pectinivora]|uniref:Acetolactate synthase small subunit n=1 Tax=Natranaerovirga pectinivora TaxID=682400 RepID=A0A4R3MSB9_9FIRM|nr:acetolactate synthase small subunit [Natranaerovirga pectinivora]TCT16328.1 acetolactate synthase small subunit [Natranaerovirga pectinivora]
MKRLVLSVLVANHSGVLSRVAGLFSRRGYNIDSLSVGVTSDPEVSRMTIVARGDDQILEQIVKQLNKLVDVKKIVELPSDDAVYRELALIKVKATADTRSSIIGITDIFRAKIIDVATEALTIEITGDQSKLDALVELLQPYEIKEIVRTGLAGLKRGNENIQHYK